MSHWNYQVMKHTHTYPNGETEDYYAIHEYYNMKEGGGWTLNPITLTGESVEDLKEVLRLIAIDIDRHGVKEYKNDDL